MNASRMNTSPPPKTFDDGPDADDRTFVMPGAPPRLWGPAPPSSARTRAVRLATGESYVIEAEASPASLEPATLVHVPARGPSLAATGQSRAVEVAPRAPVPAPLATARKHALFREQAVEAYLAQMRDNEVLRVAPPWARSVLATACVVIVALFAATFVVEVDQTGRGRGVLRVAGGVQTVTSQTTGSVLELGARSGDGTSAGALLVKVDSTATKTALLEAERQIARAEEDVATFTARRDKEQAARIGLLGQRAALLAKRAQSQRSSVEKLRERLSTYDHMVAEGVATALDRGAVEAEVAAGQRSALALDEEISATHLQSASITAELGQELDRRRAELARARDRRDALAYQLQQTEIRAPRTGRVEAMVVKVGDAVQVGTPLARVIPDGAPRQVVVFLPEADRAFLTEGADVRVELDQLPVGEFGGLHARVTRIARDLATPAEIGEALGEAKLEGPTYRVELDIEGREVTEKVDRLLRPGSLVTARFVLRKRRLATLLFEPLKRFLDG